MKAILEAVDTRFFHKALGLRLFTTPIANNRTARRLVGRMGVVPSGCAENGEYHHAQVMMHLFRLLAVGQADRVWRQIKPIFSVCADERINGPFETTSTSYASDAQDPHFGQGMYFGLSGSVSWIIELFEGIAGIELNLHDPGLADLAVHPRLPPETKGALTLQRVLHQHLSSGGYRRIPLRLDIRKRGAGKRAGDPGITINGRAVEAAEVRDISKFNRLEIEIRL